MYIDEEGAWGGGGGENGGPLRKYSVILLGICPPVYLGTYV